MIDKRVGVLSVQRASAAPLACDRNAHEPAPKKPAMKRIVLAATAAALLATNGFAESYIPFSYPSAAGGSTYLTGVRGVSGGPSDQVYISGVYTPLGSAGTQGLTYQGSITSNTGSWYTLNYPGDGVETITSTALYGPNNLGAGIRVVGSYKTGTSAADIGVMYEGPVSGIGGTWTKLQVSGSINTIAHSNYGNLAVGNYDTQLDEGRAFVYNINAGSFSDLTFSGITPTSWTAYGIWQNPNGSYVIAGGFSLTPSVTGIDQGYIVDYDAATGLSSNFRAYNFGDNPVTSVVSHFDGITSDGHDGFNLTGDWIGAGESVEGGLAFFAHVGRNANGSFTAAEWLSLSYPGEGNGPTSGNTVYEKYVLGIYVPDGGVPQGYMATIPEIDPKRLGSVLALMLGAVGLLERRRLKAA